MHCFGILLVFLCVFRAVTAAVETETPTSEQEGLSSRTELNDSFIDRYKQHKVDNESSVVTDGPYRKDAINTEEITISTQESSEEIDSNIKESTKSISNKQSDEIEAKTTVSAEEIESDNEGSVDGIGSNAEDSSEEVDITTIVSSAEIGNNNEGSVDGIDSIADDSSEEVDITTTVSSAEIGSSNEESVEVIDSKAEVSSEGIDSESIEHSKQEDISSSLSEPIKTTSAPTRTTEGSVFPNQKVLGMNIGLYFVLEEIRRKLAFSGQVPTGLVVKVLVMSSKIEQIGGEVIPLNQQMMKIVQNILPSSFRVAACSSDTLRK